MQSFYSLLSFSPPFGSSWLGNAWCERIEIVQGAIDRKRLDKKVSNTRGAYGNCSEPDVQLQVIPLSFLGGLVLVEIRSSIEIGAQDSEDTLSISDHRWYVEIRTLA